MFTRNLLRIKDSEDDEDSCVVAMNLAECMQCAELSITWAKIILESSSVNRKVKANFLTVILLVLTSHLEEKKLVGGRVLTGASIGGISVFHVHGGRQFLALAPLRQ